ncbi:hypothetical protein [Pseudobdellovibrio exovorus]|uniref:Uncharacterized protein n=1 Tax=Pseudobdellovibrio exovorus JSS TaxID=1184267 RepID=M4VBK5_9BACT|nr:hypothetical protein [Pseudobdellovibrio exovorus]AGH95865.1 hypothetical protein A11Q_1649 [Pseudobdellovibrio exovorus JSS]
MHGVLSAFILALALNLLSLKTHAEYRVFVLHIQDQATESTRQVQSTLDPEQYKSVYPLKPSEIITYVDTWRCRGRTDFFKEHCPNPKTREPAEAQD